MAPRKFGYSCLKMEDDVARSFENIYNLVEKEWRLDNRGHKIKGEPQHNFHSTLVVKIPIEYKETALQAVKDFVNNPENKLYPFKASVDSFHVSDVDRIKDKKVICLFASIKIEKFIEDQMSFLQFRRKCGELTKGTIAYNENESHVSIAYTDEKYRSELSEITSSAKQFDFTLNSFALIFGDNEIHQISFNNLPSNL